MASGRAAFALKKYSWSHDNSGNGKGNYNHLSADNIYLVLEGESSARGSLKLQIIQSTNVLDEIDLAKHIDIAISTRETFQRVGRQIADKQLPTYAVTSGCKLAITHRPEDGQVRRMQVALRSESDCTSVINHLRYRGMVFVDAVQKSTTRPATTDSDLRSVNTNGSSLFTKELDGAKAQKYRGVQRQKSQHELSQTPASDISNRYAPSFLAQRSADTFLYRDENAAPRVPHLDHPTASQVFPRVTTAATQPAAGTRSDPVLAGLSSDSSKSLSFLFGSSNQDTTRPALSSLFPNTLPSSTSLWPKARPIEELLPPERVLPFDQARRERSRSSSVLSLSALPKPQLKAESTRSTSARVEADGARERSESAVSCDRVTRSKRKHMELESGGDREQQMPPPPPPQQQQLLSSSEASRSSPKDMHELLYGKRPRVDGGKEQDAAQVVRDKMELAESSLSHLTSSIDKVVQSSESLELARYATLSSSERSEVLEKFMVDMLGNKDFATLCEDMSVCWSRLALGL